ncbi:AAA family ATPase (plasmid) [Komagataeibacter medellinensis]|uniref:AAA family ATPase n=1 Tax=Komagataeibacter medellinensis TaxID=1177712 RepID=A0ABQ6VQP8_9PROT|nr:AAA family ATPase [Komagataeibacter medellinensis]KAB8122210.1 AAA family ATPase [Komagataeibacter medellinensis]
MAKLDLGGVLYPSTIAKDACDAFVRGDNKHLMLCGAHGTGKSFAAYQIALKLTETTDSANDIVLIQGSDTAAEISSKLAQLRLMTITGNCKVAIIDELDSATTAAMKQIVSFYNRDEKRDYKDRIAMIMTENDERPGNSQYQKLRDRFQFVRWDLPAKDEIKKHLVSSDPDKDACVDACRSFRDLERSLK